MTKAARAEISRSHTQRVMKMNCKHNVMNIYGIIYQCAHCGHTTTKERMIYKNKQSIWIDVDEDTKQYDTEIHLQGKDIFEIIEGLEIIREQIQRDNGFLV